MARPSRTTWCAVALGVVVVVAAVVVAVLLRGGGPDSPSEAAEEWADAHLDGDSEGVEELECQGFDEEPLAVLHVTEVSMPSHLEALRESGPFDGEWSVVLGWDDAQGKQREITVGVRKEDGDFVVC